MLNKESNNSENLKSPPPEARNQDYLAMIKFDREKEEDDKKIRATEFLVIEVTRMMKEKEEKFSLGKEILDAASDESIADWNDEMSKDLSDVDRISNKFQKVLEMMPNSYANATIIRKNLTDQYTKLVTMRKT